MPDSGEITEHGDQAPRTNQPEQMLGSLGQRDVAAGPGSTRGRERRRRQTIEQRQKTGHARGRAALQMAGLVEDQSADPVAAIDRGPAKQSRRPCRDDRFEGDAGSETHRRPLVDQEPHRALAFFSEQLHMGAAGPCGHTPVHVPRVVAGLIDTGFIELHPTSAKVRQMATCARRQDATARSQIETPCLLAQAEQLRQFGQHSLGR